MTEKSKKWEPILASELAKDIFDAFGPTKEQASVRPSIREAAPLLESLIARCVQILALIREQTDYTEVGSLAVVLASVKCLTNPQVLQPGHPYELFDRFFQQNTQSMFTPNLSTSEKAFLDAKIAKFKREDLVRLPDFTATELFSLINQNDLEIRFLVFILQFLGYLSAYRPPREHTLSKFEEEVQKVARSSAEFRAIFSPGPFLTAAPRTQLTSPLITTIQELIFESILSFDVSKVEQRLSTLTLGHICTEITALAPYGPSISASDPKNLRFPLMFTSRVFQEAASANSKAGVSNSSWLLSLKIVLEQSQNHSIVFPSVFEQFGINPVSCLALAQGQLEHLYCALLGFANQLIFRKFIVFRKLLGPKYMAFNEDSGVEALFQGPCHATENFFFPSKLRIDWESEPYGLSSLLQQLIRDLPLTNQVLLYLPLIASHMLPNPSAGKLPVSFQSDDLAEQTPEAISISIVGTLLAEFYPNATEVHSGFYQGFLKTLFKDHKQLEPSLFFIQKLGSEDQIKPMLFEFVSQTLNQKNFEILHALIDRNFSSSIQQEFLHFQPEIVPNKRMGQQMICKKVDQILCHVSDRDQLIHAIARSFDILVDFLNTSFYANFVFFFEFLMVKVTTHKFYDAFIFVGQTHYPHLAGLRDFFNRLTPALISSSLILAKLNRFKPDNTKNSKKGHRNMIADSMVCLSERVPSA